MVITSAKFGRRPVAVDPDERAAGRTAAQRLCDEWPEVSWVPEEPSEVWASAAVERFAELIREQLAIFRASQKGAGRGARSLSPRPFQGVFEALQNADDLGANELRIALQSRGRKRGLLMVHDGGRVRLHHVGAMVLPWLTTKGDDPDASGRFGIGQQALRALGGPLEVYCSPFHFRVEEDSPVHCGPVSPIPAFYRPERHETLFVVPLLKSVDSDKLQAFVEELGSQSLLFLRSVRRISFFALDSGKRTIDHRLVAGDREEITLHLAGSGTKAERLHLRDQRSRRQYVRYVVKQPLSRDEPQRHEKATATWTPLGIALSVSRAEVGRLYDRLPMRLTPGFPFSLNAQFDPDAARTTLLENEWNEQRIQNLGALVAAVALDIFERDATTAWHAVPLRRDVDLEEDSWLANQLQDGVVAAAQQRIKEELCLEGRGRRCALRELIFEEKVLDGLLTPDDQEHLCPKFSAVVPEQRDSSGRWRDVLEELGESRQVEVTEALDLFDQDNSDLGLRDPEWFIAMADAAIKAEAFGDFLSKRGILLADGTRIEPPGDSDPRALACRVKRSSLAGHLKIALPIHPAYLGESEQAKRVVAKLREVGSLCDEIDSADVALQVLARNHDYNTIGRLRVEDRQLLALRDAFERLGEDAQRALGPRIGRNIELRAHVYDDSGQKSTDWTSPTEAYLPTAIDRETDSFAKAAVRTPGIYWLDSGYARILKRTGGRRLLGAQRFLVRLGAVTAARLIRPDNERQVYKGNPRPASKVHELSRPELQMLEIRPLSHFGQRYLLDDRWSPDLEAVIEDIRSDKNAKRRRQRGLFLLGVLARSWDRHYSGDEHARAVYGSGGNWLDPHDVVATWLARAASEPWLPSGTGAIRAPIELCLPTKASKLAYGGERSMFLAKVDQHVLRSPALTALRLRRGPSATDLVERLAELRDGPLTAEAAAEAWTAYRLLALYCPTDSRRPVDDISVRELREAFAVRRGQAGLLLIDSKWYAPKDVFAGERIFGRYRPFALHSSELEPLWRTLQLRELEAADCVAVLRELSKAPLCAEDKGIVLQTIRALAAKLDSMSPQLRGRLRRLPLWTGTDWRSDRPIYAFEDDALAKQAATQVAVWQSGFSSFVELNRLLEALNVVALRLEDFAPVALDGSGLVAGDQHRPQFALAVEHLRDELARGDQALHDSLLEVTSWRELSTAQIIIQENLRLVVHANGKKPIIVSADAFLLREPLTLVVRSQEHLGTDDAGGRAIASLFSGDRQKVAWAWASMWQRAGSGIAPEQIRLSTDERENQEDEGIKHLIRLQGQAKTRAARKGKKKGVGGASDGRASAETVVVQPLKDLNEYEPDEGTIVNIGESRGGVVFPTRDRAAAARNRGAAKTGTGQKDGGAGTKRRTVPAPVTDREQLALDAVRKALRLHNPRQIADLRKRHGLGADAMDELRQFYELKMVSSGEFPKEVTLQGSQLDAAQDTEDFFLAVVAGLSDDSSELRVRFIFKPLDRLAVRIKGEATLSGISDVESLEYRFKKNEPPL